jgi:hypothetical protein
VVPQRTPRETGKSPLYPRGCADDQILLLSLVMTVLSFFLRSSTSPITFAQRVQQYYLDRKDLTPATRSKFANLASRLPRDLYPILILIRLPLLVSILRQQLYIHPVTPYVIPDGSLRILHSEQSLTGQIVIGENLKDGYRFMRCDHSILGGRWTRDIPEGSGGMVKDMGDSYVHRHRTSLTADMIGSLGVSPSRKLGQWLIEVMRAIRSDGRWH